MKLTTKQLQIQQQILDQIYVYGPISRIDIVRHTNITPATVSSVTGLLIDQHMIEEVGESQSTENAVGRKKVLLQINAGVHYYIGCELTADDFIFVLTDSTGKVYDRYNEHFSIPFSKEFSTPATLIRCLQQFITKHQNYLIEAIGIAIPGHYIASQGRIASDHDHWMHFDLAVVNAAISTPIYYENNVHAMALTERILGHHQQDDNFIFLHVARGIFCSTIYQGHLYGHHNPLVGEVAHTVVNPEGQLCDCGRHGCLQTYASENWLIKKAQLLYNSANNSFLKQLTDDAQHITFDTVLKAYDLGDESITNLLNTAVKYLAAELNNLTLVIDARRLIIHGQIFDRPALFERLQQYLVENQFQFTSVTPKRLAIKPYTLYDGAIGGAGLAISYTVLKKTN